MKRIVFIAYLLISFVQTSFAQGFKVKSLNESNSDLSASTFSRTDDDGHPCGLIKVQSKIQGLEFDGSIIGDINNQVNEYWVYMSKGTKELVITRPHYLPQNIVLSDYGIDAIEPKHTYSLVLKDDKLNEEKCGLVLHVKPYEAKVSIDGIKLKTSSDGSYRVALPKGDHLCNISSEGYKAETISISTGKGVQNVDVQLESIMAEIAITCQNGTAEILIDSISRGIGGWNGKLLPGKHTIQLRQEGCVPLARTITLTQKEKRTFNYPKLQLITGNLSISSAPDGCRVFVDGEDCGKTPCNIDDVVYGLHMIRLELDSCGLKRQKEIEVVIKDNSIQQISCELVSSEKWTNFSHAYDLFRKGRLLDREGNGGYYPSKETRACYDSILANIAHLDSDFFRQIVFFPEYVIDECNSVNQCIGDAMISHYLWGEWSNDWGCEAFYDPKKAEIIASFMEGDYSNEIAQCYKEIENCKKEIKEFLRTYKSHVINDDFIEKHEEIIVKCMQIGDKKNFEDIYKRYKQITHNYSSAKPGYGNDRCLFCDLQIGDFSEALFWAQKELEKAKRSQDRYRIEHYNNWIIELKSKIR